jgi:hypothetical protein
MALPGLCYQSIYAPWAHRFASGTGHLGLTQQNSPEPGTYPRRTRLTVGKSTAGPLVKRPGLLDVRPIAYRSLFSSSYYVDIGGTGATLDELVCRWPGTMRLDRTADSGPGSCSGTVLI